MGTRGIIGLVIDGEVKATYNHFDSYPEALGAKMLAFAASLTVRMDRVIEQARALRLVTDDDPIEEGVRIRASARGLIDRNVGARIGADNAIDTSENWYQLLRNAQGDLDAYLDLGVMEDSVAFADDSLFCEWGYLIDLDRKRFETYRGFVTTPHTDGRFGKGDSKPADWEPRYASDKFYYPIRLLMDYRLDSLDTVERYVSTVTEAAAKQEEDEKED